MHRISGSRESVLAVASDLAASMEHIDLDLIQELNSIVRAPARLHRAWMATKLTAAVMEELAESQTRGHEAWYTPRSPYLAAIQSAMCEHALRLQIPPEVRTPADMGREIWEGAMPPRMEKFDPHDPGWIRCVLSRLEMVARPKARWTGVPMAPILLEDSASFALMADWGANNATADQVAKQIAELRPDYTVHLGDIYYIGAQDEVDAMLKIWPWGRLGNFSLPGNHEFYSGGWGYGQTVLQQMSQDRQSTFWLSNNHWNIIGLDTAWNGGTLVPEAYAWLRKALDTSFTRRTILLSHHQPLSCYSHDHDEAKHLRQQMGDVLDRRGPIAAWFFGHEHRATIYRPEATPSQIRLRLIGNGAIPQYLQAEPEHPCVPIFLTGATGESGGYANCGFVSLRFEGKSVDAHYVSQDGKSWYSEILE